MFLEDSGGLEYGLFVVYSPDKDLGRLICRLRLILLAGLAEWELMLVMVLVKVVLVKVVEVC